MLGRQIRTIEDGALTRQVDYTTNDLPRRIIDSSGGTEQTTELLYDASGMRVHKAGPTGATTYIGGIYERREAAETQEVTHVFYVLAEGRVVAQIDYEEATSDEEVLYLHDDSLGSVSLATNEAGDVVSHQFFSPFGERIDAAGDPITAPHLAGLTLGFTGHEHDEALGLVNMNGRIYSPTQRRFLTPDPIIGDPFNPHSWTPHSYALNNPLRWVDPSGLQVDDAAITTDLIDPYRASYPNERSGIQAGDWSREHYGYLSERDEGLLKDVDKDVVPDDVEVDPGAVAYFVSTGSSTSEGTAPPQVRAAGGSSGALAEGGGPSPKSGDPRPDYQPTGECFSDYGCKGGARYVLGPLGPLVRLGRLKFNLLRRIDEGIRGGGEKASSKAALALRAKLVRIGGQPWRVFQPGESAIQRGCEEVARSIQRAIGGRIYTIRPNTAVENAMLGPVRNAAGRFVNPAGAAGKGWYTHQVVVRSGRVYDALTGPQGMAVQEYRALWEYAESIHFGF